ncbi:S66 peptidase family protein [Thermaerobacillus caldiproteolyticus]|uniref:S66 peptidase family protein n=1 Tax=Thermaerobacillus caldiproteolyticus TaxID=247480 RepID=UPI00188CB60F|nr:S66 peptidase family protein [Anoxybacillus caldiproteolyticus]QPA32817.1 LD-carboxypeptidase [Anoxybacillus caldiproteolyticus]
MLIRPKRLQRGDTIGIVSPSSGIAALCPRRLERGMEELKRLGFKVMIGKNARKRHEYMAGTVEERIEDLHEMFANPEVTAIIATIGGTCSHQLLEDLDYHLIKHHPKIFMGYSDITALHLAIYKQTGLVTFLGPAILPQFGEYGGLLDYTKTYFEDVLMQGKAVEIKNSDMCVFERLRWDQEDDRKRTSLPNKGMRVLKPGHVRGNIIAGNMGVLLLLAGTPYFPNVDGAILCIEDDEEETPASIDRYLTQMRQMGIFERIQGLVIGRFHPLVGFKEDQSLLEEILLRSTRGYDFPIVYHADFGHTDPMAILPNGINAELKASKEGEITFRFLEAAVDE